MGFGSEEEGRLRGRVRERITSRFSRSDSEGGDGDGEGVEGEEDDDGTRIGEEVGEKKAEERGGSSSVEVASPEVCATPREGVAGYGLFRRPGVVGGKEGDII